MPSMQLPRKLLPFLEKKKRFKIAIGGRGSGKSMSFANICLMDAQTKNIKTGCFREFQNSIDDSVHSLLSSEIGRLELQGFEVQNNKILYEGQVAFKFSGLARNPSAIKGMFGFTRFWVEEAQTISIKSLKDLTPTLRTEESEIWMSANPQSSADPFSQRFIKPFEKELNRDGYYEDDLHLIVKINYSDNPLFPEVLRQEMEYDKQKLTRAEYLHIWEGHFNDEVEGSIIPVDWFDAAIDAHKKLGFKPKGAIIAAFDPSDEGGDSKGFAVRQGSVVLNVCEKEQGDINQGCDWACDLAHDFKSDVFLWDGDGIGAGLKRQISSYFDGRKVDLEIFKGSEAPEKGMSLYKEGRKNKDTFRNKRAQKYWELRDRFYNTFRAVNGEYTDPDEMISLSSDIKDIDQLRAEVCRVPKRPNPNGLIQIRSKPEMLKMGIPSPNMADALMMTMHAPNVVESSETIGFTSYW